MNFRRLKKPFLQKCEKGDLEFGRKRFMEALQKLAKFVDATSLSRQNKDISTFLTRRGRRVRGFAIAI